MRLRFDTHTRAVSFWGGGCPRGERLPKPGLREQKGRGKGVASLTASFDSHGTAAEREREIVVLRRARRRRARRVRRCVSTKGSSFCRDPRQCVTLTEAQLFSPFSPLGGTFLQANGLGGTNVGVQMREVFIFFVGNVYNFFFPPRLLFPGPPHTTRDFPVSRLSSSLLMAPLPPDGRVLIVFFF